MKTHSLLFILILFSTSVLAQRYKKIPKFVLGMEIGYGQSFPNYDDTQNIWKPTFYPAGELRLLFSARLMKHWIVDLGAGATGYALINKGLIDKYIIDFASPLLTGGISYNFHNKNGKEQFLKVSYGMQLGYDGNLFEDFQTYEVEIESKQQYLRFIRPEIGIRRALKKKVKGTNFKMAYELVAFFRYNIDVLGTAKFIQKDMDFATVFSPRGSIIGVFFKLLMPMGLKSERIRVQQKKIEKAKEEPVIYNPRF